MSKCPICAQPIREATHRPFCSDRCRMVDLGRWLNEDYRVSRPIQPDEQAEPDDSEKERDGGLGLQQTRTDYGVN